MSRWAILGAALIGSIYLARLSAAPVPEEAKAKEPIRTWRQGNDRLNKVADMPPIDANTALKEALAFFSDRHGLKIIVEPETFKEEGIQEAENQPVQMQRMDGIRLERWFLLLLKQANADYFIDADGVIFVVQEKHVPQSLLSQKVTLHLDKKPLNEALRQLGEQTGLSIVLDEKRVGDKAKAAVTADLRSVKLDAALTILADLADLRTVLIDRAVYVTTRENAREMRKDLERKQDGDNLLPPAPPGPGQ